MILTVTATRIAPSPDQLGESPIWDDRIGRLYWVDGVKRLIRFLDYAEDQFGSVEMPSMIGSIALTMDQGKLVVGLADGIYIVTLETAALEPLYRPDPVDARVRFNDGKVDHQGRFVCGTMGVFAEPVAELVRISADKTKECLANGIRISNSVCFSPDGGTLYFADSLDRQIRAYHYAAEPEPLTEPRILVNTKDYNSGPDGATVDSEGFIWVALVQAGKIGRFAPDGTLDRLIDAPVDMPSCITFGGPDMSTLFMTSIKDSGTGRAVSRHPHGGYLFALEGLGVTGRTEPRFGQNG
ncbi:Sugar lactone lactonase YvrE [Pseudosulfitobacter pseudonitzschiae]|uniref:Transcriptional regulator n=1 Tax=Pseudosulfitobacter pseudonitzschiae TaxID=1402135 RepID=A0A073J002_9RHOB|nr:SMP-30/gluconolactonase/LRE family protein [Pseudosulfitobacter pseudonitzschiae]KEJ95319.1 transcriptional regulator [Pseudosulfitobacter pseudonitzschiae]QKS11353.1 SMP-30/gluconolactonase/LRE family protein [Pseudosulfitobacter pseudonitzschiae]SHF90905.1 Sugar lactone lactonase YvrE [Pseudosulfitobacter pseudonitzschiae]